jgi:hypothetical protein
MILISHVANTVIQSMSANSNKRPDGESRIWRKWPYVLFALFALVLFARETGLLTLTYNTLTLSSQLQSSTNDSTRKWYVPEERLADSPKTLTVSPMQATQLDQLAAEQLDRELRRLKIQGTATVHVSSWERTGLYWTPVWKSAHIACKVDFDLNLTSYPASLQSHGSVEGTIDCNVKGLCSVYTLRQIVLTPVTDQVLNHVKESLEKAKAQEPQTNAPPTMPAPNTPAVIKQK